MRAHTPIAKAIATGRTLRDPKRFRDRMKEHASQPLGEPSKDLGPLEEACWHWIKREVPWLTEADRMLAECACVLRARIMYSKWVDTKDIAQLRMCLGEMGATPASRSKVPVPDDKVTDDPGDAYIN